MTDKEIYQFIENVGEFGDEWTYEQVKDVYGNMTLKEALSTRRKDHEKWTNIVETLLNR